MPVVEFDIEHVYPDEPNGNIPLSVKLEAGNASTRLRAFVDTGASFCLFRAEYAELLDLDLRTGERLTLFAAGGEPIEAYGHSVVIEVLGQRVDSMVYFTDHPKFARNVLGRQGWLDRFKFGLIHHDYKLYLGSLSAGGL